MSPARILVGLLVGLAPAACADAADPFRFPENKHGKGELKYVNGLPVLFVEGTPEEIGEQSAVLAVKPGKRMLSYPEDILKDVMKPRVPAGTFETAYKTAWGYFTKTAEAMAKDFPEDYKKELDALVKAGDVDRAKVQVGNTMFDAKNVLLEFHKAFGCSALLVEADKSATGQVLFGRNLDFPSAGYLNEYSLVTVCKPKGKHAFVSVGFPGLIGCLSGMNDAGLCVAVLEVYETKENSPKFDPKGTPYALCIRRLLEECTTVEEAEKALRAMKRATLMNLAVCDTKRAAVFEFTSKSLVVRPSEDKLCSCTNHFRTKELAASKECYRYDLLAKCKDLPKLDLPTVAKKLDAVNQGEFTLQTMIFEPAALKLHLAFGKCPSSALPLKSLDVGPWLKK